MSEQPSRAPWRRAACTSVRGLLVLWLLMAGGCVSAPDSTDPVLAEGEQLLREGVGAYGDGDYASAASLFGKALTHYQGIDDAHGILVTRLNLAELSLAMGNSGAVRRQLDAIDALAAQHRNLPYGERLQLLRAGLAIREGDADAAEAALAPLLADGGASGDRTYLVALANRVRVALLRDAGGDGGPARADRPDRTGAAGGGTGAAAGGAGGAGAAGTPDNARSAARGGAPDEAAMWIARLEAALGALPAPDPVLTGRLRRYQAELALRTGALAEAEARLRDAYAQYQQVHYRPGIAASLEDLGRLALRRADTAAGIDQLRRALLIRTRLLDREASLALLRELERAYAANGDGDGAREMAGLIEVLNAPGPEDWRRLRRVTLEL